jgi:hypothetical protein
LEIQNKLKPKINKNHTWGNKIGCTSVSIKKGCLVVVFVIHVEIPQIMATPNFLLVPLESTP